MKIDQKWLNMIEIQFFFTINISESIFINKKESKAIFNLLKRLLLIFLLKTTHETFKI